MPRVRRSLVDDKAALLAVASIIAIGGLIYELILGTASSYLLGDSIVSFSLGIGFNLFGMGIGSLLAIKFLDQPEKRFIQNELLLSVIGGYSVVILFLAFSYTQLYWLVFISLSTLIGVCIGLEIPLVVASFKKISKKESSVFLSNVLAVDYVGALAGSLLFPFILLPYLGIVRTGLAVGALNLAVVVFLVWRRTNIVNSSVRLWTAIAFLLIVGGLVFSTRIESALTAANFKDPVVYFDFSEYQRVVVTQYKEDTRLYLNDQLQFSSVDEFRYHETMAHAAATSSDSIKNVLILGGGDGLLARELLSYSEVEKVTIVDLDPAVTKLGKDHPRVSELNNYSLRDDRVEVINQDALNYIRSSGTGSYQLALADLVDPANDKIAKLYSLEFYEEINRVLDNEGVFVTQASSTFYTPRAFWSIYSTMNQNFETTVPLSINIPSFGEWGFVLASKGKTSISNLFGARPLPDGVKYASRQQLIKSTELDKQLLSLKHDITSSLLRPQISRLYNEDLGRWSAY